MCPDLQCINVLSGYWSYIITCKYLITDNIRSCDGTFPGLHKDWDNQDRQTTRGQEWSLQYHRPRNIYEGFGQLLWKLHQVGFYASINEIFGAYLFIWDNCHLVHIHSEVLLGSLKMLIPPGHLCIIGRYVFMCNLVYCQCNNSSISYNDWYSETWYKSVML